MAYKFQHHSFGGANNALPPDLSPEKAVDTHAFLRYLSEMRGALEHMEPKATNLFQWDKPATVARAPGRMDVMGGIADYSGSLVLQMPIREACYVAMQLQGSNTPSVRILTITHDGELGRSPYYECPVETLFPEGQPIKYEAARDLFKANPTTSWAAYIVGCLLVLASEGPLAASALRVLSSTGVSVLVRSEVPEGKGVSSSAALEVAAMCALLGCLGLAGLDGRSLALLCQKVENLVVGAPCGVMDQMASALGQPHSLLALLCQPAEVQAPARLPAHVAVWGIDSGIRHSVGGSDYTSVRVGAFMGLRIASSDGKPTDPAVGPPAPAFGGHLANLTPSLAAQHTEALLPIVMLGSDFLALYSTHYDTVTTVDDAKEYAVRQPALHPVHEHFRVRAFRQALLLPAGREQMALLGELMLQSHASYSACGLGSDGTDRLVDLVREEMAGGKGPLWGAKITGGGCGGTVCVLADATSEGEMAVRRVVGRYAAERGVPEASIKVFEGSSVGAVAFGYLTVHVEG